MLNKIKIRIQKKASQLSKKQWVMLVSSFLMFWFVGSMFVPSRITFSYAGTTCDTQIVFLPSIRQSPKKANFDITHEGGIYIGSKHVFSSRSCLVANSAPKEGAHYQRSSPFGLPLATLYRIEVPKAPALQRVPEKTDIAITKPLHVTLDAPDTVHTYHVASSETQRQKCVLTGMELHCGLDKLGLVQGAEYDITLHRSFASEQPVELAKSRIALLPAITVTGQSIKPNEKVFSAPKELVITTDKQLSSVQIEMVEIDGNATKPVAAKTELREAAVALVFGSEVAREKTYKVTMRAASSTDGRTLAMPHEFTFSTSGGPKVLSANIGPSGVSPSAAVHILFDQPLAKGQDIARYARISGVTGAVSYSGNKVKIALSGAARCVAFTITIDKGLVGENSLISKGGWSYSSRTNCRSTSIIGSSLKGRPITAYYYGSGATTILFTGGIHGTEASGSYILKDWIAHLDSNAYKIPAGRQVVVIPDTNPDGLAVGTRDNARGVNVDRNFPTSNWKTDINSANGFRPGGGGASPASEPETQALMRITSLLRPRLEVSYHAQGSIVGASACGASGGVARSYASGVGYRTMIGNAEDVMGYELTGEYEEWICEAYGTPAILIELPNRTGRFLSSHLNTMWQMVRY